MNVVVVAGGKLSGVPVLLDRFDPQETFYVGVDAGAYFLLRRGYPLHFAVGDFDSLTHEQELEVREKAGRVMKVPPEKEDTDLQLAFAEVLKIYPEAHYFLLGISGGRIDHFLTTLFLPLEERFCKFANRIHLLDFNNWIDFYLPGEYEIQKIPEMKYWGVVALTKVTQLEIKGLKYELQKTDTFGVKVYPSNEFIGETANLQFKEGMVATIQSRDSYNSQILR